LQNDHVFRRCSLFHSFTPLFIEDNNFKVKSCTKILILAFILWQQRVIIHLNPFPLMVENVQAILPVWYMFMVWCFINEKNRNILTLKGSNQNFCVHCLGNVGQCVWIKQCEKCIFSKVRVNGVVCIVMGYMLDSPGSIHDGARLFSSSQPPDCLWGPPSLVSNGYWGLFPQGWSGLGTKLTTYLHIVPRSKKMELYLHSLICLSGIVLN
jgi:hypothetical protein